MRKSKRNNGFCQHFCPGGSCPSRPHPEAGQFSSSRCVPGCPGAAAPALELRESESVSAQSFPMCCSRLLVVSKEDPLKGHVPLALCVLREGIHTTEEQILEEIVKRVRQSIIGPVTAFRNAVFVKRKTRSGKIPRSALSALVNGNPYKVRPTIEDPSVFRHIEEILKQAS